MENWAFGVGLFVGAVVALSAVWVFLKKQEFSLWGTAVLGFGVVLIGMSVWSNIKIRASEGGIEFEVLRQQVQQTAQAAAKVAEEVETVAQIVEGSKRQLLDLTEVLQTGGNVPAATLQPIRDSLRAFPTIDRARLDSARVTLDTTSAVLLRRNIQPTERLRRPPNQ